MRMNSGSSVACNISYASPVEHDRFPKRLSISKENAAPLNWPPITGCGSPRVLERKQGIVRPNFYRWADPRYALVHSSIVACQANLLQALQAKSPAETSGVDNLKTMKLVFASYDSARLGQAVAL